MKDLFIKSIILISVNEKVILNNENNENGHYDGEYNSAEFRHGIEVLIDNNEITIISHLKKEITFIEK